jgi:hypothetical protein
MGSKGSTNTTTSSNAPPQQFLDAYSQAQQQAQNVASVPYQSYPGQTVAQFSPDQIAGMDLIEGQAANGGVYQPYLDQAQNYITQANQPLLTPELQQQLQQNSGQALVPATQAAVSGIQGATAQGTQQVNQATSAGQQAVGSATGAGTSGIMGATAAGVGGIQGATSAGVGGIMGAGNSLTPESMQQWEDPYTQQVVNATQAQFNNQNAQQQAQVTGNTISQGAFGGDRGAVASALTTEQQQLAQAPVIAGLENQGFQTALGAAQQQAALQTQAATSAGSLGLQGATSAAGTGLQGATAAGSLGLQGATTQGQLGLTGGTTAAQLGLTGATTAGQAGMTGATTGSQLGLQGAQAGLSANEANAWLASQSAFGESSLGSAAQNMGLTNANAVLQAGGLQQQMAQENLNIPYEQYLAAQAYPFQTAGWEANIAEGLGGASGGTASTTSPAASAASQYGGLAIGAGALGIQGYNAYNAANTAAQAGIDQAPWDEAGGAAVDNTSSFVKTGGRIMPRHAFGGGTLPRRASGGMSSAGLGASPIDSDATGLNPGVISGGSPVPGASGFGAAPSGKGSPYILGNYGNTSTTTSSGGDSVFGTIAKTAGDIAASYFGGPAGGMAASALGSQVHFRSGGMIPRRDSGGGTDAGDSGVTVNVQQPAADPSQSWTTPLVQETLASQMAASLGSSATDTSSGMKTGGMVGRQHFDIGGFAGSQESPWWERSEAAGQRHGLLASPIAGRTDKLAVSPAAGSYVIPADVISGLGEGNTLSGANVMQHILDTGPHGIPLPRAGAVKSMPHPPPAYREGEGDDGMASGGGVPHLATGGISLSPATAAYISGNGLGGFGLPSGNGTFSPVPYTGINPSVDAAHGQGSSNTGNAQLDNYLNSTQAGASYAKPLGYVPPPPPAAPAAAAVDPATAAADAAAAAWAKDSANPVSATYNPTNVGGGGQASGGRVARRGPGGGTGGSADDWAMGDPSPIYGNTGMTGLTIAQDPTVTTPEEFGPPMPLDDTSLRQSEGSMGSGPPPLRSQVPVNPKSDIKVSGGIQGPPKPPPASDSGSGSGSSYTKPDHKQAATDDYQKYLSMLHPSQPDIWGDIALAGFSMAAGKSPHALENIGSGAAKGMAAYLAQKQEASKEGLQAGETAERMADTAAYREGMLNYHGAQTQNTADRNATYASQVATLNVVRQHEVELKASGLDEKTAHDRAMEDLSNGKLDAQIQHYSDMNQHYQRSDANASDRNTISRESLNQRVQAMRNTQEYRTTQQQLATTRMDTQTKNFVMGRVEDLAARMNIPIDQAYAQIMKQYPQYANPPAGGATPPAGGTTPPPSTGGGGGKFAFPP